VRGEKPNVIFNFNTQWWYHLVAYRQCRSWVHNYNHTPSPIRELKQLNGDLMFINLLF